jgi:hypothetical protein
MAQAGQLKGDSSRMIRYAVAHTRHMGTADYTDRARMTKDSGKSNQPDIFAFIESVRYLKCNRQRLPETVEEIEIS